MARKPVLNPDSLAQLGLAKLTRLVLDEAARSAPFRKLVMAALAGTKGPDAVAKLIDRRLGALEKARGFIDWDRARAFRDDLAATRATIVGELGEAAPGMAIERLLRFVASHEGVFERVDDSSGRVQGVYEDAICGMGDLAARLAPAEADRLPGIVMAALGQSSHGYLIGVANAFAHYLSPDTLARWDATLAGMLREQETKDSKGGARRYGSPASQWREVRQIIAEARGDLDGLIALEDKKPHNLQDPQGIARRLLDAGRPTEALAWIRRESRSALRYLSAADLADGAASRDAPTPRRASLEALILDALGDKPEAQTLRWNTFADTLDVQTLRDYLAALPDFEEFDALDRAFAHALSGQRRYLALEFLLSWPRLDLASRLIVTQADGWSGQFYHILAPAAETLEEAHPLAASILYRALLDDILAKGRSSAYPHAAGYFVRLDLLEPLIETDPDAPAALPDHATYRAAIAKAHARKSGFWALVTKQ
jgi:hypothetical protein